MALGSGNNYNSQRMNSTQQNQQPMYEPTYYSRLKIKNPVDNLALSFSFWKGTLKISISESSNTPDGKNRELAYIHLSPTKAKLFADGVNRIISDVKSNDIFGVDTGVGDTRGFIAIGKDKDVPYLFIAKVSSNGSYDSAQRFNFNMNYNYLLNVRDINNLKCQKEYNNNIELIQLYEILTDYSRFASGAIGASFYDIGRYEAAKTSNLMRKIAEKIGVQVGSGSSSSTMGGNSYFNNVEDGYNSSNADNSSNSRFSSNGATRNYNSIDDLESELG